MAVCTPCRDDAASVTGKGCCGWQQQQPEKQNFPAVARKERTGHGSLNSYYIMNLERALDFITDLKY